MDKICGYLAYCVANNESMESFMTLLAFYGDPKHRDPAMCHKWGWFKKPLWAELKAAGFSEVTDCEPRYHFPFRDQRVECVK